MLFTDFIHSTLCSWKLLSVIFHTSLELAGAYLHSHDKSLKGVRGDWKWTLSLWKEYTISVKESNLTFELCLCLAAECSEVLREKSRVKLRLLAEFLFRLVSAAPVPVVRCVTVVTAVVSGLVSPDLTPGTSGTRQRCSNIWQFIHWYSHIINTGCPKNWFY